MKKYNKSNIMKKAWEIRKARNITMSAALKASWNIAKGGFEMTIEELIARYNIRDGADYGQNGQVLVANARQAKADGVAKVKGEIAARKPEILAALKSRKDAEKCAAEERQAKIDAIPGLKEIRAAREAAANYRYNFRRSFEGEYAVGGMGVGSRPNVDLKALRTQYPIADAYLRAEAKAESDNYQISAIGEAARERIINAPESYAAAIAQMDTELGKFAERHLWD